MPKGEIEAEVPRTERRARSPKGWVRGTVLVIGVLGAVAIGKFAPTLDGWTREAGLMAAIFWLAALFWATEAMPLMATALLTIGLQLVLLANPGNWTGLGFENGNGPGFQEILNAAADPILLLFFGGFVLARAAEKEGVDRAISSILLRPFGRKPLHVAFGIMLVTALFSMWMSNTATTAMMLALVAPLVAQVPPGDAYRKVLVLAVPFAANIGGIGTPIASPPNAVAISFLQKAGQTIKFVDWMLAAVPIMALMLLVALGVLWICFRPGIAQMPALPPIERLTKRAAFVVVIFFCTVVLWMTDRWHGLPAAVVALLPALAFTVTGLLDYRDVNSLEWNILILIAGGIALGAGMQATGLDKTLLGYLPIEGSSGGWLLAMFVAATVLLGTFMSNTAIANLMIPLALSSAAAIGSAFGVTAAFGIALAASMSMALPISTPPNAMAYGTGEVSTRDMALAGTIVAIIGSVAVGLLAAPLLRLWSVTP